MRKLFLVVLAVLLVGSVAFAQDKKAPTLETLQKQVDDLTAAQPMTKLGAWGRGVFAPVASAGGDATGAVGVSWGSAPRVGVTLSGSTDTVGFQADINTDGQSISAGDNQYLWVAPSSMFKVNLGFFYDSTLRGGSGGYGAWNWIRYNGMTSDDNIFNRVGFNGENNFELVLTPVDGLYIYGAVGGTGTATKLVGQSLKLQDLYAGAAQYGVGYTIKDIGTIRAQYIGTHNGTTNYGILNAAFKLSGAVPGLTADIGAYIPTASNTATDTTLGAFYSMDAGLWVNYTTGPISVDVMGQFTMLTGNAPVVSGVTLSGTTGIEAGLGVKYALDGGYAVRADVRFLNDVAGYYNMGGTSTTAATVAAMAANLISSANAAKTGLGFLVGVEKGFTNGTLNIGFEGSTYGFNGSYTQSTGNFDLAWAIPIVLQYSF